MEDIWTIIITAVVLIISTVVGSKKKKVESRGTIEEKSVPPFLFYEEEEEPAQSLNQKIEESIASREKYFTYDNQSDFNDNSEFFQQELVNEDEETDRKQDERKFNLKEAIIYSEILNRPYS